MTTNAIKVLTHKQMVNKMLKNPTVKVEVEKLNREEFAILDEALAAKRAAALFANNRYLGQLDIKVGNSLLHTLSLCMTHKTKPSEHDPKHCIQNRAHHYYLPRMLARKPRCQHS